MVTSAGRLCCALRVRHLPSRLITKPAAPQSPTLHRFVEVNKANGKT
jgi:hypothetical protein